MRPVTSDVHVDAVMTNVSVLYRNRDYIAEMIAPIVPVLHRSDKYYIFDKGDQFRDTAEYRAPGTAASRHGFGLSTDTYSCEEIAEATILNDKERRNADSVLRLETAKSNFVTNKVLLKLERLIAAKCCITSNWGSNYSTPSNLWDDYDNSDPIADFETAIDTVEEGTGEMVNKIVISKNAWKKLKHHPQLLERLPSTNLKTATIDTLRSILANGNNIEILIGSAMYNTEKEGQTASFSPIWDKDVWVGHVAPAPALETATALYTFVFPEESTGAIRGIWRWREEKIHSDVFECAMDFDSKVVGSDLGYLLNNVIS
jgi:hypothetical protein